MGGERFAHSSRGGDFAKITRERISVKRTGYCLSVFLIAEMDFCGEKHMPCYASV